MKFLLGTKQNMTTIFTEDGRAHAATIIIAAPVFVTQIKTEEKEKYEVFCIRSLELLLISLFKKSEIVKFDLNMTN